MTFTVYDNNKVPLFTGTRQDCKHFIKRRCYARDEISIEQGRPEKEEHVEEMDHSKDAAYYTSAPIAPKPKGFFKRIFK